MQKHNNINNKEPQTDVNVPRSEVIKNLKDCHLFSKLNDEQIEKISKVFESINYKAGDVIFKQGDHGDRIYVIRQGLVNLERKMNIGKSEATVSVLYLGPCRLLGCWACLLGESRYHTESAVCQKLTQVITAKGSDLREIFKSDPYINNSMLMALCFMLGEKVSSIYGAMESL